MKRLLYAVLIFCASVSCKKQGGPAPKEMLMSSIYENDKLRCTYEYTADKKLKKVKRYADGAVAPVMEETYEYGAGGFLKEKLRVHYSLPSKYVYECDNSGRVTKITVIDQTGADSGTVDQWSSYAYNANNQLIKVNYYLSDDTPDGYEDLDYNDAGGLASIKAYTAIPGGSQIVIFWKYTGSTNRIHPSLFKTFFEPDKKEFMFLNAKSIDITLYSNGLVQSTTNQTMSERVAGGPGIYAEQTITSKQIFPVAGVPQTKKMRYEYVEM